MHSLRNAAFSGVLALCCAALLAPAAWATLDTTSLRLNNSGAASWDLVPGDHFALEAIATNDAGESLSGVTVSVDFGHNGSFNYLGVDQRTRIGITDVLNPVSASSWTSSGLYAVVTNGANPTVGTGMTIGLYRSSNSFTGFVVLDNANTYQNTVTASFAGRRVSSGATVTGAPMTATIYVDAKPHVTDFKFQISGVDTSAIRRTVGSVDLVATVLDRNGCSDLSGGTARANLSILGLTASETLSFVSCDAATKTATFKKSGISTSVGTGSYSFGPSSITVTDAAGNANDFTDARFNSIDRQDAIPVIVTDSNVPTVSPISFTSTVLGPSLVTATGSFSGSVDGSYKLTIGGGALCNGTIVKDWTAGYLSGTTVSVAVSTGSLVSGANDVWACIKDADGVIGSSHAVLTLDATAPTVTAVASPANVDVENGSISLSCNENGSYRVTTSTGAIVAGWTATNSGVTAHVPVASGLLSIGANVFTVACRDAALNSATATATITKDHDAPTMSGSVITLVDADVNGAGVDGRDVTITWDAATATGFSRFQSFELYLLPSGTPFSGVSIKSVTGSTVSTWTGDASVTTDSLGNPIAAGNYVAYVAIASDGGLGAQAQSAAAALSADTPGATYPTSARFTADNVLEVTVNRSLSGASAQSAGLVSYSVGGSTLTGTSVLTVSGTVVRYSIASLGSTAATGSVVSTAAGAFTSAANVASDLWNGTVAVADAQSPVPQLSSAGFAGTHSGSVSFTTTNAEALASASIVFERTAGVASTGASFALAGANIAAGTGAVSPTLSGALTSGSTYRASVSGVDASGNAGVSAYLTGFLWDNAGPAAPAQTAHGNMQIDIVTPFAWAAAVDDAGYGSGPASYAVSLFTGTTCSGTAVQTYATGGLSWTATGMIVGTWSWFVQATDNAGNVGTVSACDSFSVVSTCNPQTQEWNNTACVAKRSSGGGGGGGGGSTSTVSTATGFTRVVEATFGDAARAMDTAVSDVASALSGRLALSALTRAQRLLPTGYASFVNSNAELSKTFALVAQAYRDFYRAQANLRLHPDDALSLALSESSSKVMDAWDARLARLQDSFAPRGDAGLRLPVEPKVNKLLAPWAVKVARIADARATTNAVAAQDARDAWDRFSFLYSWGSKVGSHNVLMASRDALIAAIMGLRK